ncbi:RagB/SusD family nutrient uptake outer membrane protein [Sphingobacterium sp. SGG-5]|uniref:RagB/SusD family nutrient uptake outer membrane protein n=1 Tax=Sphingobacterium sp. SGG-5 TaxID=2710881 RepID=UPI0013ECBD26|nr:RagB/SusD family nutrient uptake outer membrane protein [Sphingobacterium sp. SGG-5]NGM61605.1 RagB/SusD family nutrient uptake outer membrane protein [Sphingobacterium sp. SGG-5]
MMLKKISIKYSLIAFAVLSLLHSSCNKALDVASVQVSSEERHWQSISDTKAALLGLYGLLRSAMVDNNAHWMYGELRSGDFAAYSRPELTALIHNDLNKSYTLLENLSNWRRFYAVINATSLFIERAPEVLQQDRRYTQQNLKLDIAQARAIRAFTYFYMVRIWGDVPLITSSFDNGKFPEFSRTDYRLVLKFAEDELTEAVEDLPFRYGVDPQLYYGSMTGTWQKVLFNKITAYAILSHLAAYQGKYIDVASYTEFIFDNYTQSSIQYTTDIKPSSASEPGLTGYYGIFSNNYTRGQVLSLSSAYVYGEATASGHIEQLTLASPFINRTNPDIYVSKDTINKLYTEEKDRRFGIDRTNPEKPLYRENFFYNYTNEIPVFAKINVVRDGGSDGNYAVFGSNLVFTRLEELILLRAETMAVLRQYVSAIEYLNIVKTMRNTAPYQLSDMDTKPLIDEIFEERRRELIGEGWRFHDLIRLNRIKPMNADIVSLLEQGGNYWPISYQVLENNKQLKQNDFWK